MFSDALAPAYEEKALFLCALLINCHDSLLPVRGDLYCRKGRNKKIIPFQKSNFGLVKSVKNFLQLLYVNRKSRMDLSIYITEQKA